MWSRKQARLVVREPPCLGQLLHILMFHFIYFFFNAKLRIQKKQTNKQKNQPLFSNNLGQSEKNKQTNTFFSLGLSFTLNHRKLLPNYSSACVCMSWIHCKRMTTDFLLYSTVDFNSFLLHSSCTPPGPGNSVQTAYTDFDCPCSALDNRSELERWVTFYSIFYWSTQVNSSNSTWLVACRRAY